ncbi:hypothetical protein [Glycomyces albidus]|jgi:hypothetical protein|uniref:Secreted protein n=1 Tax=Glycomyces albidus TaxID=2656774 RepID=A0A6L5GB91_9ACTN|nr:hypothetical protein [Glycomyces albidus]MQM26972.1 hypothetical protein [Glycomyces albidus]
MAKKLLAVLAAAVAGMLIALAPAGTANAAEVDSAVAASWTSTAKECDTAALVQVCVQPYGDVLWVKDRVADGMIVGIAWVDLDSDRIGECWNRLGAATGWTVCNKNFTEGHEIGWGPIWDGMSYEEYAAAFTANYTVV